MAQRNQSFQDAFNALQTQLNNLQQNTPPASSQPSVIIQAVPFTDTGGIEDINPFSNSGATYPGPALGQWDQLCPVYQQQWTWGFFTWR